MGPLVTILCLSMPPSGDCEVKPERNGTVLSLSQQGLKSVPTAVFRYVGLVELDLSRNSLSAVPAEISALRALQSLRLSWNSITSLPTQLGKLTCLRRLYLEFNGLTHLPQELGNLTQLQLIQANDNKILVLPDFSKLCALCDLNLEYNLIETVPANLCLAGNGRVRVKLRGNPIANVPPDVIVDGAILPYLRKQQQSLSGVNAARPAGQANKSPECLRTKGGVSFYVEHKKSPFRASERGGDGCETCIPENEPGPSCDPRHERYTRFHDEIEELIEKTRIAVSAGTGTCGAEGSPRPSPGRQKIHRSPAPATHSGRNLFKSSVAVPSTSNAGLQELQVTPTASTAGSRATPVQEKSPRKMKPVNFVSDRVEGMSLEECFTVNGETRKASEDQKAEEQENYEPTPRLPTSRDEAAESPITTTQAVINQEIDQETVDIVQNLLAGE